MHVAGAFIALTLASGLLPSTARAQLTSPGKLSKAHQNLEGVGSCTKCHNFGEATFRNNCLACHREIASRIDAGRGYHYFTRKLECSKCHKEHHGRDFKLIRWDPASFDHKQTGFEMTGKHTGLQCRKCHHPGNIAAPDILKKNKSTLGSTYLGLDPSCDNCHDDEHRGQFKAECANCHSTTGWLNNSFSHAKARFKLEGKHADVQCAKCHPSRQDSKNINGNNVWLKFRGIAFAQCSACHKDQHNGSFGEKCSSCHNPTGWKNLRMAASGFDHSKTHFPLTGRHESLQCTQCHKGGDMQRFASADLTKCTVCHEDKHGGQFAQSSTGGECSSCHTVEGFSPSLFTVERHAGARFALAGAHAAVPCASCHTKGQRDSSAGIRFHWDSFDCRSCHTDPHAGQFAKRMESSGCESCHTTESWYWMEFDHTATQFPLTGRHANVLCEKCHTPGKVNGEETKRFTFENRSCSACHSDRHQGQFAAPDGTVSCERCHSTDGWSPNKFDHATSASFQLTGKHAQLPCSTCHKPAQLTPNAPATIRYKPLSTACSSCHTGLD